MCCWCMGASGLDAHTAAAGETGSCSIAVQVHVHKSTVLTFCSSDHSSSRNILHCIGQATLSRAGMVLVRLGFSHSC